MNDTDNVMDPKRVQVEISSIDYDKDDIAKRVTLPHVVDLAESIRGRGLINAVIVNSKTRRLIAGRDRIAAFFVLERKKVDAIMVATDEIGARLMEIDENIYRRHDDDIAALIAERVSIEKGIIEASIADAAAEVASADAPKRGKGRPGTTQGAAEAKVAKDLGKSRTAVRKAVARTKHKSAPKPTPPARPEYPVNVFRLPVDDEAKKEFVQATAVQDAVAKMTAGVSAAGAALGKIKMGHGALGSAMSTRLKTSVDNLGQLLKANAPESWCFSCKPFDARGREIRLTCAACGGTGYVTKEQLKGIEPRLLDTGSAAVRPDGKGGFAFCIDTERSKVTAAPAKVTTVKTKDKDGKAVTLKVQFAPGAEPPADSVF